ncbi:MAG: RNA polymerase sigma factor [Acidobacteriota bacterium]|nr:RNA polymerase sigma factor [Acidobacteriota bacterium]
MNEERKEETNVQAAAQLRDSGLPAPSLEEIFREHHQRVFRVAYRVTGNAQDAEDVLQTVFMRLARRRGETPLSDRPESYLHRAAINAGLDVLRARDSARSSPLDDVQDQLAEAGERSPHEAHLARELKERIRAVLATMSPKTAEVFALRYFEGYGNHEIAELLGSSRSTIAVILHRARHRCR